MWKATFNKIKGIPVPERDHTKETVFGDGALHSVVKGHLTLCAKLKTQFLHKFF